MSSPFPHWNLSAPPLRIPVREFAEVDMSSLAIDKEESKLGVIDPFTNEKLQDAKEDEDDYVEIDFESL